MDRLRESVGLAPEGIGTGLRQIDFERDIFPVLLLEMAYVYYRTLLGEEFGECLRRRALPEYEGFLRSERGSRESNPEALLAP